MRLFNSILALCLGLICLNQQVAAKNKFNNCDQVITQKCETKKNKAVECKPKKADHTFDYVELVSEESDNKCKEGNTWTYDADTITVKKKCGAIFKVCLKKIAKQTAVKKTDTKTTDCDYTKVEKCSSIGHQPAECEPQKKDYTAVSIVMKEKLSGSDCIENKSYKFKNGKILVSEGCRAKFTVCMKKNEKTQEKQTSTKKNKECDKTLKQTCESKKGKNKECKPKKKGYRFEKVTLKKQLSKFACEENKSYFMEDGKIVVTDGCRAIFDVCLKKAAGSLECKEACHEGASCNSRGQCTCNSGYTGDGVTQCSKECVCTAAGDPHYLNFDGQKFDFQGPCKYDLSQLKSQSEPQCNYRAEVKNDYRKENYGVTITIGLDVYLGQNYEKRIWIGQDSVMVGDVGKNNMVKVNIPYTQDLSFQIVQYGKSGVQVEQLLGCNNKMSYDMKHRATVIVDSRFGSDSAQLFGMCGNCDGIENDCNSPTGESFLENNKCNGAELGLSWIAANDDTKPERTEQECKHVPEEIECEDVSIEQASSVNMCGLLDLQKSEMLALLLQGMFEEKPEVLKKVLEITGEVFEDCVEDTCVSIDRDSDNPQEAACAILDGYFRIMEEEYDFSTPWRTSELCEIKCDENETYYEFLECDRFCPEVRSKSAAVSMCARRDDQSGCGCADGFVRENKRCIPEAECGCMLPNDAYLELGGTRISSDCTTKYTCKAREGDEPEPLFVELLPCHENAKCQGVEGVMTCKCDDGMVGDGIQECNAGCGRNNAKCLPNAKCANKGTKSERCECNDEMEGDGVGFCGETCTCSHTGDPHTKQFDGGKHNFQGGTCHYDIYIGNAGEGCNMRVVGYHVAVEGSKKGVSVTKKVYVLIDNMIVTIESGKEGKTYIGEELVEDDIEDEEAKKYGFFLYFDGANVIVKTFCGMMVKYDKKSKVYVNIPREFGPEAKGLCGNCDGNPNNDFITSYGSDVSAKPEKENLFGRSYISQNTEAFENECSWPDIEDTGPLCDGKMKVAAEKACKILTTHEAFKEGFKSKKMLKKAKDIFDDCVFDHCALSDEPAKQTELICTYMAEISDMLVKKKNEVGLWRKDGFCALCDTSMRLKYNPDMRSCPKTCKHPNGRKKCKHFDSEGCECESDDLVMENGRCMAPEDCITNCRADGRDIKPDQTIVAKGCKKEITCKGKQKKGKKGKNGKKGKTGRVVYRPKSKKIKGCDKKTEKCELKKGEYKCVCDKGFERIDGKCKESCKGQKCHKNGKCTKKGCRCKKGYKGDGVKKCQERDRRCECSGSGDVHYRDFDGTKKNHQGACAYVLSAFKNDKCGYEVIVHNEKRKKPYPSYVKAVEIRLTHGKNIIVLGQDRQVMVNGNDAGTEDFTTILFSIEHSGKWVTVTVPNCSDMEFKFNGDASVKIDVPEPKSDIDYYGICGNCDRKENYWFISSGESVADVKPKKKRELAFGNGWLSVENNNTKKQCIKDSQIEEPECKDEDKKIAEEMCGPIKAKNGPFRMCSGKGGLSTKEIADLYDDCKEDVCLNSGLPAEETDNKCAALAKFYEVCFEKVKVGIDWRNPMFCQMECGDNMVYKTDVGGMYETCFDSKMYQDTLAEACVCQEGFVRSNEKCVRKTECGCKYNQKIDDITFIGYASLGAVLTLPDCSQTKCMEEDNKTKMIPVRKEPCGGNNECRRIDGDYKCVTKSDGNPAGTGDEQPTLGGGPTNVGGPKGPPTQPGAGENTGGEGGGEEPTPVPNQQAPTTAPEEPTPVQNEEAPTTAPEEPTPVPNKPAPTTSPEEPTTAPNDGGTDNDMVFPTEPITKTPDDDKVTSGSGGEGGDGGGDHTDHIHGPDEPCEDEGTTPGPTLPPQDKEKPAKGCIENDDTKGTQYFGSWSVTGNGLECIDWTAVGDAAVVPGDNVPAHNYCRNRGTTSELKSGPWCYVRIDGALEARFCDVPKCNPDDSEPDVTMPPVIEEEPEKAKGCFNETDKGEGYVGPAGHVANGKKCDYWKDNDYEQFNGTLCRNPFGLENEPWCFVAKKKTMCGIPLCYKADPDMIKKATCVVSTKMSTCNTETTIKGKLCAQEFKFGERCEFAIVRDNSADAHIFLTSDAANVKLDNSQKSKHESTSCGTFELKPNNEVVIITRTCGICKQSDPDSPDSPDEQSVCEA